MSPPLALKCPDPICVVLAIVCVGCGTSTPGSTPDYPAEPALQPLFDLSSNTRGEPLLVYALPSPLGGSSAEDVLMLARQARLVRLADLEPIAFELVEGLTSGPPNEFPAVEVRPLEPFEPVWHLLTLMDLPPWAEVPYGARTPELGVYGVRFHPESYPVVRTVGIGLESDNASIYFSEPISFTPGIGPEPHLRFTQRGQPCRWFDPSGGVPGTPVDSFLFKCSVPFADTETTVELNPGLTSPEGAPLTLFTGDDSFTATITGEEASQLTDYWLTW